MAVPVGAERPFAVVQVEERRLPAGRVLELVQDRREPLPGFRDVVAGREEVTGVEAQADAWTGARALDPVDVMAEFPSTLLEVYM